MWFEFVSNFSIDVVFNGCSTAMLTSFSRVCMNNIDIMEPTEKYSKQVFCHFKRLRDVLKERVSKNHKAIAMCCLSR